MGFSTNPLNTPQLQFSNYGNSIAQGQQGIGQAQQGMQGLGSTLNNEINGQGPNLAIQQLQQTLQNTQGQNASAIAAQQGLNPGAARYQLLNANANAQQTEAGQASQLRAQQQLQAQQEQAGLLGQQGQLGNQQFATAGGLQNQQNATNSSNQLGTQAQQLQQNEFNATQQNNLIGAGISAAGSLAGSALGLAHGGAVPDARHGAVIPGRATVRGDSYANDTQLIRVSPDEGVVPRSLMNDPKKAVAFLMAIKKAHGGYVKKAA